jgi:hypothetical protein
MRLEMLDFKQLSKSIKKALADKLLGQRHVSTIDGTRLRTGTITSLRECQLSNHVKT